MRVVFFAACRKLTKFLSAAIALTLIGAVVVAQTPTAPTQDQLNIFKSLPQDQQDALMQSLLGKGDETNKKSDSQLQSPETVQKKNDRTGELDKGPNSDKTKDGRTLRNSDEDPELRADDTVLIDLTPIEVDKDGNLIVHNSGNQTGGPVSANANPSPPATANSAGKDNKNPSASDYGRLRIEQRTKTPEEANRSAMVRD